MPVSRRVRATLTVVTQKHWRERQVKVARQMVDLAKHEGESYKRLAEPVSGLELEGAFRYVSERWLGPGFQTAPVPRMIIGYPREHRRDIAEGIVFREEREQGIA